MKRKESEPYENPKHQPKQQNFAGEPPEDESDDTGSTGKSDSFDLDILGGSKD